MSPTLLWTLAAAPRVTRAVAAQCRSIFSSGLHGRVELMPPEGAIGACSFCRPVLVSICHGSIPRARRRTGSRDASVAGPFLAGNVNDLHHDDGSMRLPAIVDDAGDVIGNAPRTSGTYIYGYDSAGNPTLTDGLSHYSSDRNRPP